MSTFEAKVDATYDFLVNRAQLGRVTNHEEIGRVIGVKLMEKRQRRIDRPVRREKVIDVLRAVDDRSLSDKGVLLSALVVHFWDNKAGHRFFDSATQRGIYAGDMSQVSFHQSALANTIAAYGGKATPKWGEGVLIEDNGSVEQDGPATVKQVREMISEALSDF